MAQSLDPDIQSQQRSESPAGSILRRLFAFWQHEDDYAPEVTPRMRKPDSQSKPQGSQAFTIWTSKASAPKSVITKSSTGRLCVTEFSGFTLWATPRSEWLVDACENHQIKLPPSGAFTVWSRSDDQEALCARWEKPPAIRLPRSGAFTVWTTPEALVALGDRQGASTLIQLPSSLAFSTWTDAAGLAKLAAHWDGSATTPQIHLSDPQPFSTWTRQEDLETMAARWSSPAAETEMIQIQDARPFSIWATPPSTSGDEPRVGLIRLEASDAHSVWTTLEGLAAASARWIPRDATAKVAPIPASFAGAAPNTQNEKTSSNITPFPSNHSSAELSPPTEPADDFANQNNMEDNSTQKIQLNESKAFTLWSTPEHWKTNTIAAGSAKTPDPAPAALAEVPATAPADTPKQEPSPEPEQPLETAGAAADTSDTWKWAFILTLIGALGIIASQSAAIGTVKDNIEREVASRKDVSTKLAIASGDNADLTDQLTAKLALAESLANEKVDLEVAMKEEAKTLQETIDVLKKQVVAKTNQVESLGAAVTSAKNSGEATAKKLDAAAKQLEEKTQSMEQMRSALTTAEKEATKLGAEMKNQTEAAAKLAAETKELGAKLKGSQSDQQAMAQELSASADALSASLEKAAALEKQIVELQAKIADLERAPAP